MTIPGLTAIRTYQRAWLSSDLVAGLVLASLLVPQGMAYAELAGCQRSPACTPRSCASSRTRVRPSRILVLGPDSSLGPMIAATVLPLTAASGIRQRPWPTRRCWP